MKRFILSLLIVLSAGIIHAQPDFESKDMPNIGDQDTVMYLVYYPITNNLDTETGNGYTWDFSSLPFSTYPNFKESDTYRIKTNAVSEPFVNATIEEFVNDGTAGDINLYNYSNDTLYLHRSGSVVAGANFIPPLATIVFPISFNHSSVVNAKIFVGSIIAGERRTTTIYDGFGTLKMPDGKVYSNVFRIKKMERDTSFVANSSITYTNYIWYKQGGHVPLLRIAYTGALNLYFVFGSKSNSTSTGATVKNEISDFNIYPNPSRGKFVISDLKFIPDKIEIFDSRGQQINYCQKMNEIDLSGNTNGIYFLRIWKDNAILTRRFTLY
jgi:hypothetical protein